MEKSLAAGSLGPHPWPSRGSDSLIETTLNSSWSAILSDSSKPKCLMFHSLVWFLLFTQYCLFSYHHCWRFRAPYSQDADFVTTLIVLTSSLQIGDCSLFTEALCDHNALTPSVWRALGCTGLDQQTNPRLGPAAAAWPRPALYWHGPLRVWGETQYNSTEDHK